MPNPASSEVGQRRFWNTLDDSPGVIYIGSLGLDDRSALYADGELVYTGSQLATGVLPFPARFKLARYWRFEYNYFTPAGGSSDWDGTNEWIFKPYSTDMTLVGGNWWMRGYDWDTANLFYDASPFKVDANGDNATTLHAQMHCNASSSTYGFGGGGLAYGYLNNHYFGHNEMGGNKPNEGVGPKSLGVIDLSKEYTGLWGAFGIAHGVATSDYSVKMTVDFDLCGRSQMAAIQNFNNQIAHLNPDTYQSEGWGTDVVAIHDNTIEFADGHSETYRQFSTDVSGGGGTMNVYTMKGEQLQYGVDYATDDCDKSGRSCRLIDSPLTEPGDSCARLYALVVTYLVIATTLRPGRHPGRQTDANESPDRSRNLDIRGL